MLNKIWGQTGSAFWFPLQQKAPTDFIFVFENCAEHKLSLVALVALTYDGNTMSQPFPWVFFIIIIIIIRSLNLQITRTGLKYRTSSNVGQIGPLPTELGTLERLKISHRLIMRKRCLQASSFIFYRIFVKLPCNQDMNKNIYEFEFRPDRVSHFAVTCPWAQKQFFIYLHFQTWISLRPVFKSFQSLKFYVEHQWGGGEAALGFGADQIKTVVVMATKSSHWLIMGKWCLHILSVIFEWIFAKLAGIQN